MTHLRRPAVVLAAALAASFLAAPGPATADRADTARVNEKHVIAISVDGLNPRALNRLGRAGAPNLNRLIRDEGAGTVNARTQLEMTLTLPNHTSMVTGRRIKASKGGHGVTWNDDTVTKTVQQAAGHEVDSVFTQVHEAGGTTAVYATKSKFWLFERSWPKAVGPELLAGVGAHGHEAFAVAAVGQADDLAGGAGHAVFVVTDDVADEDHLGQAVATHRALALGGVAHGLEVAVVQVLQAGQDGAARLRHLGEHEVLDLDDRGHAQRRVAEELQAHGARVLGHAVHHPARSEEHTSELQSH